MFKNILRSIKLKNSLSKQRREEKEDVRMREEEDEIFRGNVQKKKNI